MIQKTVNRLRDRIAHLPADPIGGEADPLGHARARLVASVVDDPGRNANTLFEEVTNAFPNHTGPDYWYWGHQHLGAVYQPQGQAGVRCRCCGHGALPCGVASVLADSPSVIWHENRLANDPDIPERVLNGFAMLALDGPNIHEAFYDENGELAWSSTPRADPTLASSTP